MDLDLSGQNASDKDKHLSGWRDLNSRPLDPQIGCSWLSRPTTYRWCPSLTVEVR